MYSVEADECTGCSLCAQSCPQGAISIQADVAVIDYRLCSKCGICAEMCPAGAIRAAEPVYVKSVEGGESVRGRGCFGRGYWAWGRGNPYAFCRFYPRRPGRLWAYGQWSYPQISSAYNSVYRPHRWW
jgi:NAD-dependent dihydropyrimidine dehydrogenase PreA subunit